MNLLSSKLSFPSEAKIFELRSNAKFTALSVRFSHLFARLPVSHEKF